MKKRVLGYGDCCYHVVSRINERRFYLQNTEKEHLITLLYSAADFSGIEILTFCIMDDHFHLLIRVPLPKLISDKELLRRIKILYKAEEYNLFRKEYLLCSKANDQQLLHTFRQRFMHRMYSLSEFVRTLKLRFSIWFNKSKQREGPLWTSRFKSVLIQSSSDEFGRRALCAVAAYIDLNAVRAELVEKPEDYAWCGYARALSGDHVIQRGLRYIFGRSKKASCSRKSALQAYRKHLNLDFSLKLERLTTGWVIGRHSFVDFVVRRRSECFRSGPFDVTEQLWDLPESGLYTVRRCC